MTTAYRQLLDRNRDHAAAHSPGRAALQPTLRTVVVCCADHRADPAHVLQLRPNEAIVLRNPGGRITPATIRDLTVLATIAAVEQLDSGFELVLMQHTDCGLSHLSPQRHATVLAAMLGTEPFRVSAQHLDDPYRAVAADVQALRANPLVPRSLVVSGLVYDLDTGLAHTVVPPAPLGTA